MNGWTTGAPVAEKQRTAAPPILDGGASRLVSLGDRESRAGSIQADLACWTEQEAVAVPKRGGALRRWIRDIAIGVALLVAVPVATVGLGFREMPFVGLSIENRLKEVEGLRVLRPSPDMSITPLQAGEALARFTPLTTFRATYRVRFDKAARAQLQQIVLPALPLFPNARDVLPVKNLEPQQLIVEAAKGVTADESAWLEQVATLPIWRDVDLVARASRVDVLGGRFEQPMPLKGSVWAMPFPKNSEVRKLAVAGIARAAWHVTRNEWREADAALRTIVSLGFAMMDDGTSIIEAMMGRAVVEIGRDGLSQLAALRGDVELQRLSARPPQMKIKTNPTALDVLTREDRGKIIAMLTDTRVPHSVRMERAFLANYLQCDSMRGILFGQSAETRALMAKVHRELGRFPSEVALLASYEPMFEQTADIVEPRGVGVLLQGAANAASALTGNPRIAGCMAPIAGIW